LRISEVDHERVSGVISMVLMKTMTDGEMKKLIWNLVLELDLGTGVHGWSFISRV